MILIRCYYADGDSILTAFNGSYGEAESYYVGNVFNIGTVTDNIQVCNGIAFVDDVQEELV